MNLYNSLFGKNEAAEVILATLDLTPLDIPRFRDCFIEDDYIVIYTRTGGGNRDYYDVNTDEPGYDGESPEDVWSCLPAKGEVTNWKLYNHPCFDHDTDDDFDSTYAYFYFRFPEEYKEELSAIAKHFESYNPSIQWQKLLTSLEEG